MLTSQIESILFISNKPLTLKKIAQICGRSKEEIETCLESLKEEYNRADKGIHVSQIEDKVQMVTSGENKKLVQGFIKEELTGELTQPQLETLTIIAYRGPVTRGELEQIRGVNCSLILRNLMIRGLVEAEEDPKRMVTFYNITIDFMRYLGISDKRELPDFERLSQDENLEKLFEVERREVDSIKPPS